MPYGTPVSVGWDVNGGGIDLASASGTLTWAQLQSLSSSPINDSGTYAITVIANYLDSNGNPIEVQEMVDLLINNVAPTATFSNTGPVIEGSDGAERRGLLHESVRPLGSRHSRRFYL